MTWSNEQTEDVIGRLGSDGLKGLSSREAEARQVTYGQNRLEQKKKTHLLIRFFMQLNDFMIVVLLSAAAVSFVVSLLNGTRDFLDPLIILMIVVLNAVLGLVQEYKAEKSLEALKQLSSPTAKVMRDGHVTTVDTHVLVPGDILVLETGDLVPADARLLTAVHLKTEESALTGESEPVDKVTDKLNLEGSLGDQKNMVFAGSSIAYGRGTAIVTATGMSTEMGKIAGMMMEEDKTPTPLQRKLEATGKTLGLAAMGICAGIFCIGLLRQLPPFDMFMTSVSLAVAAIPEGLPAIVTIMLALGVQRMAKENAIVRKLPAVETLGSANVICSDKTGTLTQNKMTVVDIFAPSNPATPLTADDKTALKRSVLQHATLCNNTVVEGIGEDKTYLGDPMETALVRAAFKMGVDKLQVEAEWPRVGEMPFDSGRKRMSTIHRTPQGDYLVITKGAPEILLKRCTQYYPHPGKPAAFDGQALRMALKQNEAMAEQALRVLGVACKRVATMPTSEEAAESGLTFLGLLGLIDPPREEAKAAVATCKAAGIKPVMVTGDHLATAVAIAGQLGIMQHGDKAMTGAELLGMDQEELEAVINQVSVFARVSPEHKVRIVKAYQAHGHVVAMTGDGVNDAPALKAADIGCAMGLSGTDVAKSAADMVLTDDNFATIVKAVEEGRGITQNIRKAVHFLLSSNIGEIITILTAIVLGWATPLLAIHLLWVNLVTDALPAIALGLDPAAPDTMRQKPLNKQTSLFSNGLWGQIVCEGLMIGFLALIGFGVGTLYFDVGDSHAVGRTMAFATLSISQLVHAFNMRSEHSLFTIGLSGNMYLVGAFGVGLLLQSAVIMVAPLAAAFKVTPLNSLQWLVVAGLSLMPLLLVESQKFFTNKRINLVNFDYS